MPLTYHYCSLETACAIISNASLRRWTASNALA
ncbi:hypothetical protein PG1511B_0798 [Bifidobacterium pseudolongum subsp. globosum]|nr:hypothetical protein PG1511B_0798 [Bifidobacterium pseudolongum subsp. globosum]